MRAAGDRVGVDRKVLASKNAAELRNGLLDDPQAVHIRDRAPDDHVCGVAEPRRVSRNRVENGLDLECRGADDAEHLADRGLPIERARQVVVIALNSKERAHADRELVLKHGLLHEIVGA